MLKLKPLFAYIAIIIVIIFVIASYTPSSWLVVITSIIIIILSAKGIFNSSSIKYGASQIFYIFTLFFLGIAPLIQYVEGVTLWGGRPFSDADYVKTNLLVIIALVIYKHIYTRVLKYKYEISLLSSYSIVSNFKIKGKSVSTNRLVIISIISSIYIYLIYGGDIVTLLLRGAYVESDVAMAGGLTYLLNSFFIRPIPAVCFLLFKYYHKKNYVAEILLLLLMLLTNAPTGMPRFAVAAFYIPLAFIYAPMLKKQYNFALFMFVAVLIIFPFLNLFRLDDPEFSLATSFSMMLEGHFDSYQMFMRVVSTNHITYGYQLLGVILFFVPRSIWPNKPIGSGYLIAHENGYWHDNLAMNYFGEGYINFGIIGVIIFSIVLAYVNARVDRKYWISPNNCSCLYVLVYLEYVGMEFAILRGALLNIFPVFVGYTLAIFIVFYLSAYKNRTKLC